MSLKGNYGRVFPGPKPVIAMVHFGALPGTPLYDAEAGLEGLVEGARKDLNALQAAGFDAVMFGNENDRPYEFKVDTASTATMAYVIGRLRAEITVPFGVNVLWDPMSTMALAAATGAALRARDLHRHLRLRHGAVDARCRQGAALPRPRSAARDLAVLYNVSAEFAYSLDQRSLADRARSAVFSSIPDAILVSGAITGEAAAMSDLEAVKKVLPEHAGARQYRRQARDRGGCAGDRRWLHRRLVAEGRRRHLERGRSGARRGVHAARARGARP